MLRSLVRDERGNALMVTAAVAPLLFAAAGFAIDTVQWTLAKRQLQQAADSAAIAGVYGLVQGADPETAVDEALTKNRDVDPATTMELTRSPPGRELDPYALAVRLSAPADMTFSSLFLSKAPTVSAEATASVIESGDYCAFAIGSSDETGLMLKPGADLEMECGIATNSSSSAAIKADASARMKVPRIVAFGGIDAGAANASGMRSYGLRQKDPLASSGPPDVPNTGCPNVTVNPGRKVQLKPGCYGNLFLNGSVTMEAGEYIINRGNLVVGPTGDVSCKACTIFLTSREAASDPGSIGKVRINQHATVKLSAPGQGPHAGILIYQDSRAARDLDGEENSVGGSGFSKLEGLLYFPSEGLHLDARMSPDMQCARFLGRRLIIDGHVFVAKDCPGAAKMTFTGTDVRLIG